MTKHYTPHIDEFHIGFEYVIDNNTYEILSGYQIDKIKNEKVLVKYLDSIDIISTGFDLVAESRDEKIFKRVVNDKHSPVIIQLKLWFEGDFPFISIFENDSIPLLQSCECKNKSELICMLKRLKIT